VSEFFCRGCPRRALYAVCPCPCDSSVSSRLADSGTPGGTSVRPCCCTRSISARTPGENNKGAYLVDLRQELRRQRRAPPSRPSSRRRGSGSYRLPRPLQGPLRHPALTVQRRRPGQSRSRHRPANPVPVNGRLQFRSGPSWQPDASVSSTTSRATDPRRRRRHHPSVRHVQTSTFSQGPARRKRGTSSLRGTHPLTDRTGR